MLIEEPGVIGKNIKKAQMTSWEIITIIAIMIVFLPIFTALVMGIVYYARENRRLDREERSKATANAH